MLSDKEAGTANSMNLMKCLVGEEIQAAFMQNDGRIWLVMKSGYAVVFGSFGTDGGSPVYWREEPDKVKRVVDERKKAIEQQVAELRRLGSIQIADKA